MSLNLKRDKYFQYLDSQGMNMVKVADVFPSKSRVSGYHYDVCVPKDEWRKHFGWVYVLVIDGAVSKVGMTEATLASRFSSYQAGTQRNRENGTCSVTNYKVSQAIRRAHQAGETVEIFAFNVPHTETTTTILGKETIIRNKHAYAWEAGLLEAYSHLTVGQLPPLCRNTSLL